MVSPDQTSFDIDEGQLEEAHQEFTHQQEQELLAKATLPDLAAIKLEQLVTAEVTLLRGVDILNDGDVAKALFTRTNMSSVGFEGMLRVHMDQAIQNNKGLVKFAPTINTLLRHFMCVGIIAGAQNRAVQP